MNDSLTIRQAAARLNVTQRHVRRLIGQEKLRGTGEGNDRRVASESVAEYLDQKKPDMQRKMSGVMSVELLHSGAVAKLVRSLPALSRIDFAAEVLGLPVGEMTALVRAGSVPVVRVGSGEFIPVHWLAQKLGEAFGAGLK